MAEEFNNFERGLTSKPGTDTGGTKLWSPVGGGDIVNDYSWTISNKDKASEARKETPRIILTEYQQTTSGLEQSVKFWANQAKDVLKNRSVRTNPYENLYIAKPTGNIYTLPFYDPYHHTVTNNWGSNKGPIGEAVDAYLVKVATVLMPTAGIESPKAWEGTTVASYNISFNLLNTITPGDIENNQGFIKALLHANLSDRINSVASFPPVIYTIKIPGVRYSPAAILSPIQIENMGQVNNIDGENIPDAYKLSIGVSELITETRQLFGDAFKSKVTAAIAKPGAYSTDSLSQEQTQAINRITRATPKE